MEGEDSILDSLYDDDGEDVEMLDVEEGELVELESLNGTVKGSGVDLESQNGSVQGSGGNDESGANQEHQSKGSKNKRKKRRNRRKNSAAGPRTNVFDLDRFVSQTCRNLGENKSYMVYTAVACLGVAALCDLIKEVNAIQACGGQMTANGRRLKTGGGLLWNIIKARDPKAYKEIMKKAKEFEKQFKGPYSRQAPTSQSKVELSQVVDPSSKDGTPVKVSNDLQHVTEMTKIPEQTRDNQSNPQSKHVSVRDRLRVPVSYDDELLAEEHKENAL
ncbi:uncharacterized protein LOC126782342 [Argentina anserina]|uniref:uncharacterized protein LOC126782342 n=1 Tax=Argentina anserina TaxID=57926 RepID=UPI00217637FC|nr:uncharacterized protein LOC126782342 [Potentilla anserina]